VIAFPDVVFFWNLFPPPCPHSSREIWKVSVNVFFSAFPESFFAFFGFLAAPRILFFFSCPHRNQIAPSVRIVCPFYLLPHPCASLFLSLCFFPCSLTGLYSAITVSLFSGLYRISPNSPLEIFITPSLDPFSPILFFPFLPFFPPPPFSRVLPRTSFLARYIRFYRSPIPTPPAPPVFPPFSFFVNDRPTAFPASPLPQKVSNQAPQNDFSAGGRETSVPTRCPFLLWFLCRRPQLSHPRLKPPFLLCKIPQPSLVIPPPLFEVPLFPFLQYGPTDPPSQLPNLVFLFSMCIAVLFSFAGLWPEASPSGCVYHFFKWLLTFLFPSPLPKVF